MRRVRERVAQVESQGRLVCRTRVVPCRVPQLRCKGKVVPLDSVVCQTVLSKLLGPLEVWKDRLIVAKECGYNMIHFTPIQCLGASNSAYSLSNHLELNPLFSSSTNPATLDQVWEIIISWDILTLNENIDVACKTQGVRQERTDFQGQQYRFSPLNTTYSIVGDDGVLHLDLGFYFRNATVRTDSKMWQYPCIERLECEAQSPPAKITVMSLLLVFGLVGAVLLTCMFVCGSIVWCLKRDRAYGVRPYTGRFVEERPDSADSQF
ncbi:uncharacterized protein LOC111711779 [Eurytemora carolleeae]|uniref:uncharacterized protein LOC111711779 n=1 Tax=Eurytemora carolleeae TaxID=1294199 RepID=UPI000C7928A6|nr:uncharacterized protein LOC111711779 [Eurytemora carolleeae]|eukprot:XP_023341982.1 uncharacterized protein LOC111711779 [Eurytemora affinis]